MSSPGEEAAVPPRDVGLHLVLDREDRVEDAQLLRQLHRPDQGTVLVEVGAAPDSLRVLGNDFLTALGKDADVIGAGRNSQQMWSRCQLWLTVENVQCLLVSRAHNLGPTQVADVIELAVSCGVELWLIAQ